MKFLSGFLTFKRYQCSKTGSKYIQHTVKDILSRSAVRNGIIIKGWTKTVRKMKDVIFLDINDGSCPERLQVILPKSLFSKDLTFGSTVTAYGNIQTTPKGQIELLADRINVEGVCDVTDNYPFTPKQKHTAEYCRQFLHLRQTTTHFSSILRVRHTLTRAVHNFFSEKGFVGIHTPIITSNDCEGAGEVFTIQPANPDLLKEMSKDSQKEILSYFNGNAYLTVSGQLHLEAMCRSLPKVYTFNPTFRAENSKSRLHLSEFYMVEGEEAFVYNLGDVLRTIEDLVKFLVQECLTKCQADMELILKYNETDPVQHCNLLSSVLDKPFKVMSYEEAKRLVTGCEDGFTKEQELQLVDQNGGAPVFVVDWPASIKPFYMKPKHGEPSLVSAVDLLVPNVGELCGGSLREDDLQRLQEKVQKLNLTKPMQWYLDLRKFGNVSTGGFGMGFERLLQYVLHISNIKDTLPFPRWPHNLHT